MYVQAHTVYVHRVPQKSVESSVERKRMRMLLTLLLTVLTATSGEDTHYSEGEGHSLRGGCVPSSLQV